MNEDKIKKAIENISEHIIHHLEYKGLLSLYLAGTILDPKERTKKSDIDFFGIVTPEFDMEQEIIINEKLKILKNSVCLGFDSRLRCFDTDYLSGTGKPKSFIQEKIFKPGQVIKKFAHFKLLWGKKYDFENDFIKPIEHKEEAKHLLNLLEKTTKQVRNGTNGFPIKDFPKFVIEMVRLEAEALHGMPYTIKRSKIQAHLKDDENHIIHKAMKLRNSETSKEDLDTLCDQIEKEYIPYIKEKLL